MHLTTTCCLLALGVAALMTPIEGHGRLMDPPSRSSMWRYGYPTKVNYNDNQLFCGGLATEIKNGYKCGVCGDPADATVKENEAGGKYATGTIVASYTQGQAIKIKVQLTANHKGWYTFKLCPVNDASVKATLACLDKHVLYLPDSQGIKYHVASGFTGINTIKATLPAGLTCSQCVLQWRYHTGNSWGTDKSTGKSCIGCGYQEEFYGCADVKISPKSGQFTAPPGATTQPPKTPSKPTGNPTTTTTTPTTTTTTSTTSTTSPATSTSTSGGANVCKGAYGRHDLDGWCKANCAKGHCPVSHCACSGQTHKQPVVQSCVAIGKFANVPGMSSWCLNNYVLGARHPTRCRCTFA